MSVNDRCHCIRSVVKPIYKFETKRQTQCQKEEDRRSC